MNKNQKQKQKQKTKKESKKPTNIKSDNYNLVASGGLHHRVLVSQIQLREISSQLLEPPLRIDLADDRTCQIQGSVTKHHLQIHGEGPHHPKVSHRGVLLLWILNEPEVVVTQKYRQGKNLAGQWF